MEPKQLEYTPIFKLNECKYTSCYCEENVYLLCKNFLQMGENTQQLPDISSSAFPVFITSKNKRAEIRAQKAGKGNLHSTVVW